MPDHPAMWLVIRHSPALFQLEMAGSAAFQMEGSLALFGHDLLQLNLDTVGLWFRTPGRTDVQLLQENNLNHSFGSGSATQVAALGQKLRRFLDPWHRGSDPRSAERSFRYFELLRGAGVCNYDQG